MEINKDFFFIDHLHLYYLVASCRALVHIHLQLGVSKNTFLLNYRTKLWGKLKRGGFLNYYKWIKEFNMDKIKEFYRFFFLQNMFLLTTQLKNGLKMYLKKEIKLKFDYLSNHNVYFVVFSFSISFYKKIRTIVVSEKKPCPNCSLPSDHPGTMYYTPYFDRKYVCFQSF